MKEITLLLLGLFCYCLSANGQESPDKQKFTISGYIKDAVTGEELLYANVFEPQSNLGATSNLYGFYSMTLAAGEYELQFSYIGYKATTQKISLRENFSVNIELQPESAVLAEVVVEGEAPDAAIEDVGMSRISLEVEQLKKMPTLLGEPDVIKAIQILPGVTNAGEGTSSFFVRGGSADQNLILIDEAPVYEVSHFFGLFSVFNSDIIKSAELYKGGIPAKYGGRLSSLLEITTKDGNTKQLAGSGGVGLMAAKLALEGPIVKDKASFVVAGRRSYADLFMRNMNNGTTVQFYDINAKINWKKSNKDRFFLAAYSGRDIWSFSDNFEMDWGNTTTTFRWNHLFSDKLFSNLTLLYSNFDYRLADTDEVDGFSWEANQKEISLKEDISWYVHPKLSLNAGYQGIYRRFSPGVIEPEGVESIFIRTELDKQFALDHALYLSAKQDIGDRLSMEYGLRFSLFQKIGAGTVYQYSDPQDNVNIEVIDSTTYDDFEVIKAFQGLEPRFSARYKIDKQTAFKVSYNRMYQYIHLLSNSTVPIPFNTWAPSGTYLQPQKSDQIALGLFRNLDDNTYELSVEAYYKWQEDITAFADNADVFFNQDIATEFRQGEGTAYGFEFFLRKTKGNLNGFLSYTWSKAEMEIDGVNNNEVFPANHDRRHNLNLALIWDITPRWNVGANFTYATGRPITLPTGRYEFENYQVNYYSNRNGYRLPDMHRMDLSTTFEPKKNENKKFKSSYTLGIYNVYNRKNPFTIYTRKKRDENDNIVGDGTEKEARLVYLFGTLPYFTWSFKF